MQNQKEHKTKERERKIKYAKENPEKVKVAKYAWAKANPDKLKIIRRKSYLKHKKERIKKVKAWAKANPEKIRIKNKEWWEKHPGNSNIRSTKWRNKHLDKSREKNKAWFKTEAGKLSKGKTMDARYRNLGSELLNNWFIGCNRHHINKDMIICIPIEIHKKYPHNHKKTESMVIINKEAFIYLTNNIKQL